MRARRFGTVAAGMTLLFAGLSPVVVAEPAGTPAEVDDGTKFTALTPVRVLDTRTGTGAPVGPASTITLDLSDRVPAGASAVVLNLTGTGPTASTFISVFPHGTTRPEASTLNLAPGETRPNLATVLVGADRKLDIYNNRGTVQLIADLSGFYAFDGAKYKPRQPVRVLDTRTAGVPVGPAGTLTLDLSGHVPAGATAVTFNLTGTAPTASTFVTAWPHGVDRPTASNLNLVPGQTSPNLVTVALGADRQVDLYNNRGSTHLVVDLAGYYGADADTFFTPVAPRRAMDTRTGQGTFDPAGPVGPADTVDYHVFPPDSNGTVAVLFNLTGTQPTASTFVAAAPSWPPATSPSNLNLVAGQTAANLVVAPVFLSGGPGGVVTLYNNRGSVHLIADVAGYFVKTCAGSRSCVYSWGAGPTGQLGDGTWDYRTQPRPIPEFPDIVAVAGGSSENLALRADGTVFAWGDSQAVPGHRSNVPVAVPGLSGVQAIAAGNRNGLALRPDGTVWAWGDGHYGQLGDGRDHPEESGVQTPVQVSGLTGVVAIAAGWETHYAVRSDGTVWAWGNNNRGQLGNGVACDPRVPATCESNVPVQVSGLTGVTAVSDDGFAVKSDGTAWTWGPNFWGLLGTGSPDNTVSTVPVQVSGLTGVVQINGSNRNRYALRSDGTVWAWGNNAEGQIGNGTDGTDVRAPVQVSQLTDVVNIASGEALNGYAVRSDGTVWSWGSNFNGQLGVSGPRWSNVPVRVPEIAGARVVSGFAFGALVLVPQPR